VNILLLTPPSTEPLARELADTHLSDSETRIIVTEPTAPDDEHDHKHAPFKRSNAYDAVDYVQTHRWPVEPAWIDTLLTLSRLRNTKPLRDELDRIASSSNELARDEFDNADFIIAFDNTAVLPLLHWSKPWAMIETTRLRSGNHASTPIAKLCRTLAPHLVHRAFTPGAQRRSGSTTRALTRSRLESAISQLPPILSDENSSATRAHHTTIQKRYELRYESSYADEYDDLYHAAIVYKRMDQRLAQLIADIAKDRSTPVRLLDLGCGPGSLVPALRERSDLNLDYVGVDLVPAMIHYARRKYPDEQFEVGDMEALDFPDNSFDIVLCSGVLHHLAELEPSMREIKRVLKPRAHFIAREPNEDNFAARYPTLAFAHLCLKHLFNASEGRRIYKEPDAHGFHRNFTPRTLVDELSEHMLVESLSTDLRVSYFYDNERSEHDYKPIAKLESTLDAHPGLNIVAVARNTKPGTAPQALETIDSLEHAPPPPLDHYTQLLALVERNLHRRGANLVPEHVLDDGIPGLLRHYRPKATLAISLTRADDKALNDTLGGLRFAGLTRRLSYQKKAPEHDTYDAVIICTDWDIDHPRFHDVVESCRDYGHFLIIPGGRAHTPPFNGVATFAARFKSKVIGLRNQFEPGGPIVVARRSTYTLVDVARALQLALQEHPQPGSEPLLERTEALIQQLRDSGVSAFYEYVPTEPIPPETEDNDPDEPENTIHTKPAPSPKAETPSR